MGNLPSTPVPRHCTCSTDIFEYFNVRKQPANAVTAQGPAPPHVPRPENEVARFVDSWNSYIHPRAVEFLPENGRKGILNLIARSTSKGTDPILGDGTDNCVHWYGETKPEDGFDQPVVEFRKPGEDVVTTTFVSRVLVFFFATDESFELLMSYPKAPFARACGRVDCVLLCHVSMDPP
mmetsp:Transcript_37171/g.89389  ORF Transcript_37171/g.89389 Transcript_37171/m.89389 type:complete len:179 (-) Transcript_37171:57-593(-)